MTAQQARPNFFVLLGLIPDAPWNQAAFDQLMNSKRSEWTKLLNHPKKGLDAKRNLGLIAEIRRVMSDDADRQAEAAAARSEFAIKKKERFDKFERQLAFVNANDYIGQSELDAFIKEFSDILSAKDVRDRVLVPIGQPPPPTPRGTDLDPTIAKRITQHLNYLSMSSLYEFLGMIEQAATPELCRAAERIHQDMLHRMPKTADVTTKGELAGLAKTIFDSKAARKKYDNYLQQVSLNALLDELVQVVSRKQSKVAQIGEVTQFLENAKKAGWDTDVALVRLREFTVQRGLSMQVPTSDPNANKIRCGRCHELNDKDQKYCGKCNEALYIGCPDCGQNVSCENNACGNCGFPVANRYLIDGYLMELDALLKNGSVQQARQTLSDAEASWRPRQPDWRTQKLSEYKAKIDRLVQQQQQTIQQLDALIAHKKFFEARQLLASMDATKLPNGNALQQTIGDAIKQAQDLVKRDRLASASQNEKIEACRSALLLCADYSYARDLLKTLPPESPRDLKAKVKGAAVSLSWDPSLTRGVVYTIVRKSRSHPNSPRDGKVLKEKITGCAFDDDVPEFGLPLYYTVFAAYNEDGVTSDQGSTLAQPVMLLKDVPQTTVQTFIDNKQVDLAWETPQNVHSVIVVRKEQTRPNSITDGQLIAELSNTQKSVIDRKVQNDHTYYYGIYCRYKDHEGRLLASQGTFVRVTPEEPPTPLSHIVITHTESVDHYDIDIKWQAIKKGRVVILKSTRPLPLAEGKVIPESKLPSDGVDQLTGSLNSLQDRWDKPGAVYYIPVVIFQTMAYIGATHRYACVEEVSNLRHQILNSAIRLQWTWPEHCEESLISYSSHGWPAPNDPDAAQRRMSRTEYDRTGHCDIRGTSNQTYFIVVSAIHKQGEEAIPAQGVHVTARIASKMVVSYAIKNPTLLRRKRILQISVRTVGALPTMLLIVKQGRLPFTKTDGELLYRLEPTMIGDKDLEVEISGKTFPPDTFGRLFLEDDSLNDIVTIRNLSKDQLRLG